MLCMREENEGVSCRLLGKNGWQEIASGKVPEATPFSCRVVLLPDVECVFQSRTYPMDIVDANALDEAVELDVAAWSPFSTSYAWLSFVDRDHDTWRVAVWIWPESVAKRLLSKVPEHIQCTHLLPEMAWYAASVRDAAPSLLFHSGHGERMLAYLSGQAIPGVISSPGSEAENRRFFRALGDKLQGMNRVWLTGDCEHDVGWLPDGLERISLASAVPRLPLLNRASLAGVKDWSDPMSWRKVIFAMLALPLLWMSADSIQLLHRESEMEAALGRAKLSAHTVLDNRNRVEALHDSLLHFSALKYAQIAPEKLLQKLSQEIPDDIWINAIRMGDEWVDIMGQGSDVARLIVIMESIKEVKHAAFLNELRSSSSSGKKQEAFQLRLVLHQQGMH